jgi:hypothetical protein
MVPQEFISSFDMYFLNPVPQFPTDETYTHEVEKTAKDIKQAIIKDQLKSLSEQMKQEEQKGNEEELQRLRVEFNSLAVHFK